MCTVVLRHPIQSTVSDLVQADNPNFQYTGRIDQDVPSAPVFCFGGASFQTRFSGTSLALQFKVDDGKKGNFVGIRIDGGDEIPLQLAPNKDALYQVAVGLKPKVHSLLVYRRSDVWGGTFAFRGIVLDKGASLSAPPARPQRRIEFLGDSVTAGTQIMALGFEAKSDREIKTYDQDEVLTNAYWSYASIVSRNLNAEMHLEAIGGLALNDGNGWWLLGLETTFDKVNPNPDKLKSWDFSRFVPHVVVIAVGQNDARRKDIHDGAVRMKWVTEYNALLDRARKVYPNAWFVLATTVLGHDLAWDDTLEAIAKARKDKVRYYRYKRAGKGTPGHPRLSEHQEMATELTEVIRKLPDVWASR